MNNLEIDQIEIRRKYIGQKSMGYDGKRILVLGEDGKERIVEEEAIKYFKQKGYEAIRTKWYIKNYLHNFLEKKKHRDLLKKEDLQKIQEKEGKYVRFYQFCLYGFPDLFVWNKKGNYFFVEVKSEKDKLLLSQTMWIRWNNNIGKFKFKIMSIKNDN